MHPSQVGRARRLVADHLADFGLNGATGEVTVLLVSELVTNAMQHGGEPVRLVADVSRGGIRVEVYDGNHDAFPAVREVRPDGPGGRGLLLVGAFADRWGSRNAAEGKCVWFEIDLKGAPVNRPDAGDLPGPVEASDADLAEQQAPVDAGDPSDDEVAAPPGAAGGDAEANEADLAEQAIEVPLDEDEQR
jgi:anti-sigma regulatory factor (Ser/Thr protein kinase)